MREVLIRLREVTGHRPSLICWAVLALLAFARPFGGLLGTPGYEWSVALALVMGLGGGALGLVIGRQERTRPAPNFGLAIAAVSAALTLIIIIAFATATIATWLSSPCDPFAAAAFVPLLPLPSALLAASAGVFIATRTTRWWSGGLVWLAVVLASALWTAWPIVFGPQVYAYNHFGGFLPGPLYDEELEVTSALLWYRAATLLLSLAFIALATRRRALALGALSLFALLESQGTRLGFRMSDAVLAARLGGLRESAHVVLHFPSNKPTSEVDRFIDDVEFRHAQNSAFLGQAPPGKVVVWWYRSADEKQRLVGAAHTQFAKPWRREVHVNDSGFPHAVLKHELMHAMAAPFGHAPFGVAARWFGLYPHVGVIEGLAVAGDNPVDDLTLHQWAAAMKQQKLLPDVRVLLEPTGFYSAPASRAYASAGSFIRWLGDTKGREKLTSLYREGDFGAAYGVPLEALVTQWETFLDEVPLEPEAVNQAFARFKRGSLFDRPCAREVAALAAHAGKRSGEDPVEALAEVGRCRALQPEEPSYALSEASLLRKLGREADARAAYEVLLARLKDTPSPWADAAMAAADLSMAQHELERARALFTRVIELRVSPTMDRTARVRLASLDLPERARELERRYFAPGDDALKVYLLRAALDAAPGDALLSYLLGRRLAQADAPAEALVWLRRVLEADVPDSIRRETTRLVLEAAWAAGDCAEVTRVARGAALGSVFSARANDWVERCDFSQRK